MKRLKFKKISKAKKVVFISLIILMFTWATTAFAVALDIDVVGMARTYLTRLVNNYDISAQLDAERQKVQQDTINYVNQYKTDVTNELNAYRGQQLDLAKQEINKTFVEVKQQLDDAKQQMLVDYKVKIKSSVEQETAKKKEDLKNNLNTEIANVFNQ